MKNPLANVAAKFRDAFTYDPGHSDLDNEQPIAVHVTLGDWRALNFILNAQESANAVSKPDPRGLFEQLTDELSDNDDGESLFTALSNAPDSKMDEFWDTGSCTLEVAGKSYVLSLRVEEEE